MIYEAGEDFPVGGSRTVREGDDVTIVAAGITLHEALDAAESVSPARRTTSITTGPGSPISGL